MKNKVKVILADDHPIFMSGLQQIIEEDENIEIAGTAINGEKALEIIYELKPDIAVLDIDMPKMTGLEVLRAMNETKSKTKVVFLTVYASEDMFDEAMELGTNGYVLKDCAVNDIVECIHKVNDGNYYISPTISNFVVTRRERMKKFDNENPTIENLTRAELNILRMIADGLTSKDIADELFISFKTVENHRSNISNKLGLKGSHSLLKFALKNKSTL
jgi:DNA-binding NarL/FixJ family response regulator